MLTLPRHSWSPRAPALLTASLLAAACSESPGPTGPSLAISVAPLTLPGVDDVEFALAVLNAPPSPAFAFAPDGTALNNAANLVWNQPSLTSGRFGDGAGALTYIGPCDASGDGTSDNHVALAIKQIEVGDGNGSLDGSSPASFVGTSNVLDDQLTSTDGAPDFTNPCPPSRPCLLSAPCLPNRDTPVTFNLTIMRRANQGFFDIAVNFDDIFCSAKLDCRYDTGPIELLHNPTRPGSPRDQTAVLAFACTTGAGDVADTQLHMNPILLTCGGVTTTFDPTIGPGNAWSASNPDPDPSDAVWQLASYRGVESLTCGGSPCNKLYWTVAIGFDPTAADCSLSTSATASTLTQMANGLTPAHTTYPWIGFEVDLTELEGGLACTQHGLDAGDGVDTDYTRVDDPKRFCHRFDGLRAKTLVSADCPTTGYFANPRPRLHEWLELVEPGYCRPTAGDADVVGALEAYADAVRGVYLEPESGAVALEVTPANEIQRGAFALALGSHYWGFARNPEAFGLATEDLPFLYGDLEIVEACEEIGRIAGLSEALLGIARQPEIRTPMLAFTAYAGNLAAQTDPKVVLVRSDTVAAAIEGAARQTELAPALQEDALTLLGAQVAPVGIGAESAAMLAMIRPTEALLLGIARQPEFAGPLTAMALALTGEPVPLTGAVGAKVRAELLAAYAEALARQPESEEALRSALIALSGIAP